MIRTSQGSAVVWYHPLSHYQQNYNSAMVRICLHAWVRKETSRVHNCCNKMRRASWHAAGSSKLGIRAACFTRMKDFQEKKNTHSLYSYTFYFSLPYFKKQASKQKTPPVCSACLGVQRYTLAKSEP